MRTCYEVLGLERCLGHSPRYTEAMLREPIAVLLAQASDVRGPSSRAEG
jgi:hypothetical protein